MRCEPVAAREFVQVAVGVAEQHVERELLGVVAEFLAVGRADQFVQLRPQAVGGFLLGDVVEHGGGLRAARLVLRSCQLQCGGVGVCALALRGQRVQRLLQGVDRVEVGAGGGCGLRGGVGCGRCVDEFCGVLILRRALLLVRLPLVAALLQHGGGLLGGGVNRVQRGAFAGDPVGRAGQQRAQLGGVEWRVCFGVGAADGVVGSSR